MYTITTTPGFIIDSRPYGEAGKILSVFTRDLGLVLATAQGIRLEKSKLRYHAQDHSLGQFSFVRGKEFWRLTSAGDFTGFSGGGGSILESGTFPKESGAKSNDDPTTLLARIASLLKRLLQGEEPHPELFAHIEALSALLNGPSGTSAAGAPLNVDELKVLESVIVLRILHDLGYVRSAPDLEESLKAPLSGAALATLKDKRLLMNEHINKALRESHL